MFYLFMIKKKLDSETYHYLNKLLIITMNFSTKHSQKYFYLFIHMLSKVPSLLLFSNWNQTKYRKLHIECWCDPQNLKD